MRDDGGFPLHLIGHDISVNERRVSVTKLLGEGNFSRVYLVKENDNGRDPPKRSMSDTSAGTKSTATNTTSSSEFEMVLKVTTIETRNQREVAEQEAHVLSLVSHPSIVKLYEASYRTIDISQSEKLNQSLVDSTGSIRKDRSRHFILTEYCEGGSAQDVCNQLLSEETHLDLSSLVIAFGQICNAVSYLHSQEPPIVHRNLKPANFLVKNGEYKLCDFGSAIIGSVSLKTPGQRGDATEVIHRTTTPAFRAPEMVDIGMAKRLTPSTDVWALGCCLYEFAFLRRCFHGNSADAILSRDYKIPNDNPYGDDIVELIERMLTVEPKARADMSDVILCLSAIYSREPLPRKKKRPKSSKLRCDSWEKSTGEALEKEKGSPSRKDGQSRRKTKSGKTKRPEGKKLDPNSVAARRKRTGQSEIPAQIAEVPLEQSDGDDPEFMNAFSDDLERESIDTVALDIAFSVSKNPFASTKNIVLERVGTDGVEIKESKRKANIDGESDVKAAGRDGTQKEKHSSKIRKSVTFSELQIREYERALGDHPSCSEGPPVSIGWEYDPNALVITVDDFERSRPPRRSQVQMVLPRAVREEILSSCSCTQAEIAQALRENRKTKHQRRHTINNLGKTDKFEEALEGAKYKLMRALAIRKNRDETEQLMEDERKRSTTSLATI